MMSKYILSALILSLLFITSCTRDICEKSCVGCVELEKIFYISSECEAHYKVSEDEYIKIELIEIKDQRTLFTLCETSTGGQADVKIKVSNDNDSFTHEFGVNGCLSADIPDPDTVSLGNFDWNGYKFYFHKLLPRSGTITEYPLFEEYETILSIKKL